MFKGTLASKEVITSDAAFGAHAIMIAFEAAHKEKIHERFKMHYKD